MAAIDISSAGGGGSVSTGVLQLQNGVAMDSTLRNVSDQNNTTSPLKLSTTAVQVTSPLRITTSDASGFYLDAEDSATNNRFSIKRDPSSQEVTLDFASNPTGSTTLVGAIRTYRDGTNLSNAMSFIEDGSVGVGTDAPVGILDLFKSAAATRLAIRGDAGQNRLISYRTGAVQRFGLYVNNTAESGSNAGSNFAIRAYNDAGTLLSTPFFIERSTGNVGINNTTPTETLDVNGQIRTRTTTGVNIFGAGSVGLNDAHIFLNQTQGAEISYGGNGYSAVGGFNQIGGNTVVGATLFRTGQITPTARLQVRGSGSTSATTALLVENSAGTQNLNVKDNGEIVVGQADSGFKYRSGVGLDLGQITNSGGGGWVVQMWDDSYTKRYAVFSTTGVQFGANLTGLTNTSAQLSADSTTKGFLPPRMTTAQKNAIATPAAGLMVYDTDLNKLCVYTTAWETITSI